MIKMLNVYTQELDDPEKAVREILQPLDIKNSLLKNSAALLFCHVKFIETGVAQAVYKNLPFDVVGCTSLFFGTPMTAGAPVIDSESDVILTVTILTSDDIEFTMGISGSLNEENVDEGIQELYRRTAFSPGAGPPAGPPALVFTFLPTITSVSGDVMAAALDRACAGIPIFGSLALDMNTRILNPKIIFKAGCQAAGQASGECGTFSDRIALLLFRGPVKPRFFHSSFPDKSIMSWDAVITGAVGNRIISINNKPSLSFLKDMGFFQDGMHEGILVYPLVVEYPNNETEVVIVQDISPEGQLICGRTVKAGGILNMVAVTADTVLESVKIMSRDLKKNGNGTGFIMFSNFLRNIVLGGNSQIEYESVCEEMDGCPGSWLFLNSGGELCPGYTEKGELVNRFHQYAVIACQF